MTAADMDLVAQFLDAVARAKGISRADAERRILLDAARKWQAANGNSSQPRQPQSISRAAPMSPASLTILLVVAGVLAILAGAIFVLTK